MKYEVKQPKKDYNASCKVCNTHFATTQGFEVTQKLDQEDSAIYRTGIPEEGITNTVGSFEKFVFPMIKSIYPNLVSSELVSVFVCSELCADMYILQNV
jgi:hypothetical protein